MMYDDKRSPKPPILSMVFGVSSPIIETPRIIRANSSSNKLTSSQTSNFCSPSNKWSTTSSWRVLISVISVLKYSVPKTAIFAAFNILSVIPPKAETTMTTSSCWLFTISLTFRMFSALPTEVPPNFNTFIRLFFQFTELQLRIAGRHFRHCPAVWSSLK